MLRSTRSSRAERVARCTKIRAISALIASESASRSKPAARTRCAAASLPAAFSPEISTDSKASIAAKLVENSNGPPLDDRVALAPAEMETSGSEAPRAMRNPAIACSMRAWAARRLGLATSACCVSFASSGEPRSAASVGTSALDVSAFAGSGAGVLQSGDSTAVSTVRCTVGAQPPDARLAATAMMLMDAWNRIMALC